MRISIIVAVASNGVIGKDGKMPWHLPSDLKHFKKTTTGNAVVMGRKTFESIGKPLPNRMNIVLSRQKNYAPEGVHVVTTPEAARKAAQDGIHVVTTPEAAVKAAQKAGYDELMVIGGGEVYYLFRNVVTYINLTHVLSEPEGDTILDLNFDKRQTILKRAQKEKDDYSGALSLKIGLNMNDWQRKVIGNNIQESNDRCECHRYVFERKPDSKVTEKQESLL